jgi:thiol-disulfide isomerase/thioredoxin
MGQTLSIGDKAPALEVSQWVKGDKIERLEKDQTYVVEFWATWCGPCKVSIPHLTELQKKYQDKGVKIIGVSVMETDPKDVEPFVKKMGDKMEYSVAIDDMPKGDDANPGKMAKNWLMASQSEGIPTAFIVKTGKIAWIGHPMDLEERLEKVISPKFDFAKAISEAREEKAKELEESARKTALRKKIEEFSKKLSNLGPNASRKQMLELVNKTLEENPDLEGFIGGQKYVLMVETGDKGASAYGMKLVEVTFKENPRALSLLAWMQLDPEGELAADKRDNKLALKAAVRANELTQGEDGTILDVLAQAYFKTGDPTKALEAQEKAVKLLPEGDSPEERQARVEVKARLEQYKKAVADKKKP